MTIFYSAASKQYTLFLLNPPVEAAMVIAILVASVLLATPAVSLITDCGSLVGEVQQIEVSGCKSQAAYCPLKQGTTVTISITFTPKTRVDEIKVRVYGVIAGVSVPFKLSNENGCNNSGVVCPMEKNKTYTYRQELPILKHYPKIKLHVKWELQDGTNKDITCSLIAARITS